VWGIYHWGGGEPDGPALPEELTVAKLREQMSNPQTSFRGMRETMERKDLTDEQRRQVRRNMGQVFRSMMNERVDEFFAAYVDSRWDLWRGGRVKSNSTRPFLWQDVWGENWSPTF